MYPAWWGFAIVVLLIWLIFLSYVVNGQSKFLGRLFPKDKDKAAEEFILVRSKLIELLDKVEEYQARGLDFNKNLAALRKEGLSHTQKMALRKYNPYQDTGGDHSFTMVFLDGADNGVLITNLHSRSGTRIYSKIIKRGQADIELSKEEKEVLEEAVSS